LRRSIGLSDIAASREVARLVQRHDVVHAHASKALLVSAMAAVPFVWSAHGYDSAHAEFPAAAKPFADVGKAFLVRRARAVSVASRTVAAKVEAAGVPAKRIRVVYTGVNVERFGRVADIAPAETLVVGAAGRLLGIKGFDVLVEAASRVLSQRVAMRFVLYGDGPRDADLRRRIAEVGIGERFDLRPATDDLPRAFAEMDLVVVPSRLDSFPLVPCEAMAAGRPIIATRVGGLPEAFVDGVHGFLIDPGDPDALANALIGAAGDRDRLRTMGSAARAYAKERYNWGRVADEYDELYRTATR
jgi:glycosyltransferase involved in cell wall biosynthesis